MDIKPYMKSYTVSELAPSSRYEVCIAVNHDKQPIRLNCTVIITHPLTSMPSGAINVEKYIIGGSILCVLGFTVIILLLTWLIRRFNQRRCQHEDLYGDNMSQLFLSNMDNESDTTPITYENRAAEIFDDEDIQEIRSAAYS